MTNIKDTVDSVLKEFDLEALTNNYDGKWVDTHTTLTLPIHSQTKAKYDELQSMTDKKFGKALQKITKAIIDRVHGKK